MWQLVNQLAAQRIYCVHHSTLCSCIYWLERRSNGQVVDLDALFPHAAQQRDVYQHHRTAGLRAHAGTLPPVWNYAIDGRRGRRTRIRRIRAHAGGIDCAHAPTHLLDEYMYMYPG